MLNVKLSQSLIFAELTLSHWTRKGGKGAKSVCVWVSRVKKERERGKKTDGDGTGGKMRGTGGDKDGCVKEWIRQGREIIMQQLKHR